MINRHFLAAVAICALLLPDAAPGQVPNLINYQGRVVVGSTNFNGTGQFKFALVDGGGTTLWRNHGSGPGEPAGAVPIPVTGGLYSVLLGDSSLANMGAIPAGVFSGPDVWLRVWFNDGINGSQQLTPDQRIAAVGYAIVAGGVPDGAITTAKIANGAVGQAQLATDAVGANQLANGSITTGKIAAGAVGRLQLGRGAVSGETWDATAASGLSMRQGHTAVWTGSEMIVWGGTAGSGNYFSDGSRYNPALNTWTPLPASGLAGRFWHTAIWTGTEMIVWGGTAASGTFFNDGARYNPVSNSWTALATATGTAPTARRRHTAVWTGSEMIVWGGFGGTYLNTGARYNPAANSWTDTSASGGPGRSEHTAVWSGSEMIVWGGSAAAGVVNDGRRYNPLANTWVSTTPSGAPEARFLHTAVWTGTEMIVWGGAVFDGSEFLYVNDGARYRPATNSWTPTATSGAPVARSEHKAVWTGSEMIVWGGINGPTPLNTGGYYNPAANLWSPNPAAGAPSARFGHTAVWSGAEMIAWGGFSSPTYFNDGARLQLSNIRAASVGTLALADNAVTSSKIAVPLNFSGGSFAGGSILSGTNSNPSGAGVSGTGGTGVAGIGTGGVNGIGVSGDGGTGTGVKGTATSFTGLGVFGDGAGGGTGVKGIASGTSGAGVLGSSDAGVGVSAHTKTGVALYADAVGTGLAARFFGDVEVGGGELRANGVAIGGIYASVEAFGRGGSPAVIGTGGFNNATGVSGIGGINGYGIYGSSNLFAGWFAGAVNVTGALTKGGGAFRIDHPLDPANKYLSHSFVESPDMMNIYNGNVILDRKGEAVVKLPAWFSALNKEFRYQLTCLGGFAPVYVAQEIADNRFKIAGGKRGLKVSWQVTGVRQDSWANANRIPVEEEKPARERGSYLHPETRGQPAEKSVEWARHPEMMRAAKARPAPAPASKPK
jgi:hypothetical protein